MSKKKTNIHFEISERKILLRAFDVGFVLVSILMVQMLTDYTYFYSIFQKLEYGILLVVYLWFFGSVFELYDLQKSRQFDNSVRNIVLTVFVTVLFYLLTPRFSPSLPSNRIQIVFFVMALTISLVLWRYIYVTFFVTSRFNKRVLLVANGSDIEKLVGVLETFDPNYRVIAVLDTGVSAFEIPEHLIAIDLVSLDGFLEKYTISEVVVASRTGRGITAELNEKLMGLLRTGIAVRSFVSVYEDLSQRLPVRHMETDFYDYFPFSRSNRNKLYLIVNRALDIFLSLLGLSLGVLLLPFVLIGNLLGNRGPLLYSQVRVGKHGEHFTLYKLRSMIKNAETDGAQFSYKGDCRITRFGKFLRRTRIDEFPQFVNVLKGDMALIGPRPERPEFVESLSENIPFYSVRHVIKPGITGWAQVMCKYGENEEDSLEKLQYDLYYIKHRGAFLDTAIVIKTLSTILFFRGQ